jgi:hypothetical protein
MLSLSLSFSLSHANTHKHPLWLAFSRSPSLSLSCVCARALSRSTTRQLGQVQTEMNSGWKETPPTQTPPKQAHINPCASAHNDTKIPTHTHTPTHRQARRQTGILMAVRILKMAAPTPKMAAPTPKMNHTGNRFQAKTPVSIASGIRAA